MQDISIESNFYPMRPILDLMKQFLLLLLLLIPSRLLALPDLLIQEAVVASRLSGRSQVSVTIANQGNEASSPHILIGMRPASSPGAQNLQIQRIRVPRIPAGGLVTAPTTIDKYPVWEFTV